MSIVLDGTSGITTPDVSTDDGAVYAKGNILGTVSQSAGVPTGAIIERGSNANGEFVRYADGTQICTRRQATSHSPSVTSTVFTWIYPTSFLSGSDVGVSGVFYCLLSGVAFRNGVLLRHNDDDIPQVSNTQFLGRDFNGGTFDTSTFRLTAIGRWF